MRTGTVAIERREPDRITLTVDDSGPGVPDALAERVFDPFVTGRKRGDKRSGTGLGLAIARAIVERHAGHISVGCSALGGGAFQRRPAPSPTGPGRRREELTTRGGGAPRPQREPEAHTGTLFLDEVGDMPPSLQVKVLRTLESGEILPVGADRPTRVDVRIISATNRDLDAMQSSGDFREDLYWRLKGAEVVLPPLRERPSDIPLLAAHFLARARGISPTGDVKQLSPEAVAAMLAHGWPGNLRELRHEMQRATVLAGDRPTIQREDLAFVDGRPGAGKPRPGARGTLAEKIEALERREIELALTEHHNNRTHASAALGLSRQGLLKKMARYGMS